MGILVKLLGRGIGFTSEAIHAYRSISNASRDRSTHAAATSSSDAPTNRADDAPPQYDEVANEAAATELIRSGRAERVIDFNDEKKRDVKAKVKSADDDGDDDDKSSSDSDRDADVGADEAIWELDDAAERVAPPSYTEAATALDAEAEALAAQPEDTKLKRSDQMVSSLVQLAGPPPSLPHKLPYPVILPQRRPRNKDRGFVRAYAPVLNECGIGQDTFLKFLDDWLVASRADRWLDVVLISASVVGFAPELAAQVVSTVVQVAAGTAREIQSRARRNSFLDRVNEQLLMPRGLFGMVMAFQEVVRGQQRGPLARLAGSVGTTLFARERLDIDQTAAKFASTDAELSGATRKLRGLRLASGKTVGALELPQAAELVYPALDRAMEQDGEGKGKATMKEKIAGGMNWVQEYADRRARAIYQSQNPTSPLAMPSSAEKPFQSRFSDPNHPASSGSLLALLSGGHINPYAGRRARRREYKDAQRIARGRAPRGQVGPDGRLQRKPRTGLVKRVMQQDVLYFIVVNLPTADEVDEGVARLETVLAGAAEGGVGAR